MKAVIAVLLALVLGSAQAQAGGFPERPVTVYVGGGAGGSLDIAVRTLGPKFLERFGQPLVIVNKPGAYGMLAASAAADTPPDGYHLSTITPGALDAMVQSKDPSYAPSRLSFVVGLVSYPLLVVVKEDGPRNIAELVASKPALWGTANTIGWIAGDTMLDAAGIEPRPQRLYYRGKDQEMLREVIRGDVPFAIVNAPGAIGLVRGKKLRMLAVVARKRSVLFPDTPTLAEAFAAAGLPKLPPIREAALGITAPAGTPESTRKVLRDGIKAILAEPDIQFVLNRVSMEDTDWNGEQE